MTSGTDPHEPSGNHPPVAGAAPRGTTPVEAGTHSAESGAEHGLRGRTGAAGLAGSATTPQHATRYLDTALGVLSYAELAPHLADSVAAVERSIAADGYAAAPLDEHLILRLHADIAAKLVPDIGGHWRKTEVSVGEHTPPLPHQVLGLKNQVQHALYKVSVLAP